MSACLKVLYASQTLRFSGVARGAQLPGKKNKYILGTYTVLKDDITVIDRLENNSK